MDAKDQAIVAISNAMSTLTKRRDASTDPAEKAALNQAISDLNDQMTALDAEDLLSATQAVAAATDALESHIAAAKVGPLGGSVPAIEDAVRQLQAAQSQIFAAGKLPKADGPSPPLAAPAASPAALPPINPSTEFRDLGGEYQAYFAACVPDPAHVRDLQFFTGTLQKSRPTYESVGSDLAIPWYFIGLLHGMECEFDFGAHLHNGNPLTARTVDEPRGRPPTGSPPFTWQASARDALTFHHFDHQADWSLPRILYRLEAYNGFGYRFRRLPSPYLWSFSNLYKAGKFIADNVFDPTEVSQQCGAAVALRALNLPDVR